MIRRPPRSTLFPYHDALPIYGRLADEERTRVQDAFARSELQVVVATSRSEEHTSELQSPCNLVCRLLLEKKKKTQIADHARNTDSAPTLMPPTAERLV